MISMQNTQNWSGANCPVWFGLMLACAVLCGCHSNPQTAAYPPPPDRGERQIYAVNYETAWAAALGAAEMDNVELVDSDKNSGHIWAKVPVSAENIGQQVNIWVRTVSTNATSIQVVSRRNPPIGGLSERCEHLVLLNVKSLVEP